MAKVEGRREDETAEPRSQTRGIEKTTLIVVIVLALIGVAGLLILAA